MRLVKIGRFIINLDRRLDPLKEPLTFILKGEEAKAMDAYLTSLSTPWCPPVKHDPETPQDRLPRR